MNTFSQTPTKKSLSPPPMEAGTSVAKLRDGTTVLIRPILRTDADLEREFVERLSHQSRRFRFLGEVKTLSPELLKAFVDIDQKRDVAFVALIAEGAYKREIGVCRYNARRDGVTCECAVAVSDDWQNRGLGTLLMQQLIDVARSRGIECIYSVDAADNAPMQELAAHLGFTRKPDPTDPTLVLHCLDLKAASV